MKDMVSRVTAMATAALDSVKDLQPVQIPRVVAIGGVTASF